MRVKKAAKLFAKQAQRGVVGENRAEQHLPAAA